MDKVGANVSEINFIVCRKDVEVLCWIFEIKIIFSKEKAKILFFLFTKFKFTFF